MRNQGPNDMIPRMEVDHKRLGLFWSHGLECARADFFRSNPCHEYLIPLEGLTRTGFCSCLTNGVI